MWPVALRHSRDARQLAPVLTLNWMDAPSARPTLWTLPPEIVLSILAHLPAPELLRASLLSRTLSPLAQHTLFRAPHIRTLDQLSSLLSSIEQGQHRPRPVGSEDDDPHRVLAVKLRELTVSCREVGSKGWGPRIGKVLRLCTRLRTLALDGVPDLRIKHLVGCGGELVCTDGVN